MEVRSNNKAKHRSQKIAFGLFRLLSLCIVLILFVMLGVYHFVSYGWNDGRRHLAGYCRYFLSDGG